jgi:hypothetical protein
VNPPEWTIDDPGLPPSRRRHRASVPWISETFGIAGRPRPDRAAVATLDDRRRVASEIRHALGPLRGARRRAAADRALLIETTENLADAANLLMEVEALDVKARRRR